MVAAPRLVSALVAGLLTATAVGAQGVPSSSLRPLPTPDLSRLEPALAVQIEGLNGLIRSQEARGAPARERAEAWGTLGHLYYYYDFLEAAADAYANAQVLAPEAPRWSYHRGVLAADRGDAQRAAEHFAEALRRAPGHPQALVRLGRTELALDRREAAAEHFAQAVQGHPDLAAAWEGLGRAKLRLDDLDEAIAAFERALQLQPEATAIHAPLAQALRRRGRPGDLAAARAHLERWGDVKVSLPDPYMEGMGRATALSSYALIQALAPQRSRFPDLKYYRFALGTLEGLHGAVERLARDLEAWPAERRAADSVARARLHYVLGGVAGHAGRPAQAVERYGEALELLPDLRHARVERALELVKLGRREEARSELERVFSGDLPDTEERDPTFVEGRLVLAKLLLAAGEAARARDHFDRVAIHRPGSLDAWLGAAAARVLEGRREAAMGTLEVAADAVPDPADREVLTDFLERLRRAPPETSAEALLEGIP